jgi:hypothetical protein
MARAAASTATPARRPAALAATSERRHRRGPRDRSRQVTLANRRGRDCSRHARGDEISRAVQVRRRPDSNFFALALFAIALLVTSLRETSRRRFRFVSPAVAHAVPGARMAFGRITAQIGIVPSARAHAECLTFRHKASAKFTFCAPIQGTKDSMRRCESVYCLAARGSVRLGTQPNIALLLTH